jgi:hypothetical protein
MRIIDGPGRNNTAMETQLERIGGSHADAKSGENIQLKAKKHKRKSIQDRRKTRTSVIQPRHGLSKVHQARIRDVTWRTNLPNLGSNVLRIDRDLVVWTVRVTTRQHRRVVNGGSILSSPSRCVLQISQGTAIGNNEPGFLLKLQEF